MKSDMSLISITKLKSNKGRKLGKASMLASFFVSNKNQKLNPSKFIDDKTKALIRKFFKIFSNEKKYELPYQDFKKLCENEEKNINTNRLSNLMRHALSFYHDLTAEFIRDLKSLADFESEMEKCLKIKYIRSDQDKSLIFTMLLDEIEIYIKAGVGKYKKPEARKMRSLKENDGKTNEKMALEDNDRDKEKPIYEGSDMDVAKSFLTMETDKFKEDLHNRVCEKNSDEGEREKTTVYNPWIDHTKDSLHGKGIGESDDDGERKKPTAYKLYFENPEDYNELDF